MRLIAFALLAVAIVSGKEKICEPGTLSKMECNNCTCSADGTFQACTLMACPEYYQPNHGETIGNDPCEPNTNFKRYCNDCHCGKDGRVASCTLKDCPPGLYNEDGSRNPIDRDSHLFKRQMTLEESNKPQICEPGKIFPNYCNECRCSKNGKYATCTYIYCPPGIYNQNGTLTPAGIASGTPTREKKSVTIVEYEEPNSKISAEMAAEFDIVKKSNNFSIRYCEPGKEIRSGCNTCRCSNDGTFSICPMKLCPSGNADESLNDTDNEISERQPRSVRPGQVNETIAIDSHSEEPQSCEPGVTFKYYCNTCRCSKDGTQRYCTLMLCPPGVYNEDGTLRIAKNVTEIPEQQAGSVRPEQSNETIATIEKLCEPGKPFKNDCNYCKCSDNGLNAICTKMLCPRKMDNNNNEGQTDAELDSEISKSQARSVRPGQVNETIAIDSHSEEPRSCEPGVTFKYYCNTCRCSKDGRQRACTMMLCPPGVHNKDGTLRIMINVTETSEHQAKSVRPGQANETIATIGKRCEPGKKFKDNCNNCRCSDDGLNAICTKMLCPPKMDNNNNEGQTDAGLDSEISKSQARSVRPGQVNETIAIDSHSEEPQSCEPGVTFKYYCNTCRCSKNGRYRFCTLMNCTPGVYNEDGTLKIAENVTEIPEQQAGSVRPEQSNETIATIEKLCEPGKPFKRDCNYCKCSDNGLNAICTKMLCPPKMDNNNNEGQTDGGLDSEISKSQARSVRSAKSDGTIEDISQAIVYLASTVEKTLSYRIRYCESGKTTHRYCNTCRCSNDGTFSICTVMSCPPGMYNEDGSLNMADSVSKKSNDDEKSVRPGQGDGAIDDVSRAIAVVSATIEKNDFHRIPYCESGKIVRSYCNTCRCSKDGTFYMCTLMMCPPDMYNVDGSLNIADMVSKRSEREPRSVRPGQADIPIAENFTNVQSPIVRPNRHIVAVKSCEPGKRFRIYCNFCDCMSDGISASCMKMECPRDIFNEDGTFKRAVSHTEESNVEVTSVKPEQND